MVKGRNKSEGSIYERKDGRWEARLITGKDENGKPKKVVFYGKTKKEHLKN